MNTIRTPKPGHYDHTPTRERAEQLVAQEVRLCVSALVYNLGQVYDGVPLGLDDDELSDLCCRITEIYTCDVCGEEHEDEDEADDCCPAVFCDSCHEETQPISYPVDDAGELVEPTVCPSCGSTDLCHTSSFSTAHDDVREAYEHWAVSEWLARKPLAEGEIAHDTCIGWVWGRRTTGQQIAMDAVILAIAASVLPEVTP